MKVYLSFDLELYKNLFHPSFILLESVYLQAAAVYVGLFLEKLIILCVFAYAIIACFNPRC